MWEKVWVDGVGYETSTTYDSMDRVKTMTYPDGEVVTYAYRPNGMLTSVSSSLGAVYVGETLYTAWGAVDLLKLGPAASPVLQVDYTYYPWT
ncbi:MAG: RHS repeat domain-containing protein, partial [Chloroflexia bacterium]